MRVISPSKRVPSRIFISPPLLLLLGGLGILGACSGGTPAPPIVTLTDAAPPAPDAAPAPDAFVCTKTSCGEACVDTATDPQNCGGCGITCQSAGQICSGSVPCECPAPFVPSAIGGGGFDQIQPQGNVIIAIAPTIAATLDVALIVYDLTLTTGMVYDLTGTLTSPSMAAGYDVDTSALTAHTAYAATTGTITFDTICNTGASGSLADLTLSEVKGVMDPTPVDGGCSLSYPSLKFDIGSCPTPPGP